MSSLPDTGRAVFPKCRPSTIVYYTLDEDVPGSHVALVGGADADLKQAIAIPIPSVVPGPTGRALRFDGTNLLTATLSDASTRDAMEGSWTMHVLIRLPTAPSGTDVAFGYIGNVGDGGAPANNYMAVMSISSSGLPRIFWEHSGGSDVQALATKAPIALNEWSLETWRKTITTPGPGPGGRCTLERFKNGVPIEAFTDVVNTSGGTTAKWHMGAQRSGVNASAPIRADFAFASVDNVALSDEEIALDFRNLRLGGCSVREDGRALIADSGDNLRDTTDLEGLDWFQGASISSSKDDPIASCAVELVRENANLTLATLRTDSKLNLSDITDPLSFDPLLTDAKRRLQIESAVVPVGLSARPDEMIIRLDGLTDRIDFASDPVKIEARDRASRFIQGHIEEEREYGDDTLPVASEDVIQSIFDDSDSGSLFDSYDPETIFAPVISLFSLLLFAQALEPVLAAARKIAAQRGWDFRLRYDYDPAERRWRMTYYEPPRDALDASFHLTDDDVTTRPNASMTAEDRRTHCRVAFPGFFEAAVAPTVPVGFVVEDFEAGDVDDEGNRLPGFVLIRHTDTSARVGRFWMGISEYQASQISDLESAANMAVGCLRDTSEGSFLMSADSPYLADAALDDYIFFAKSEIHTATQRLAVVALDKKLGDVASTSVQLSGSAKAGYKRWLDIETRGRNARPAHHRKDGLYSNVDFGRRQEALRDTVQRSKMLRGGRYLQTFNFDYAQKHRGIGYPPDGWVTTAGTWGTELLFDEVFHKSGGRSIVFDAAIGLGRVTSDRIALSGEGDVYAIELTKADDIGTRRIEAFIEWYDVNDFFISAGPSFQPGSIVGPNAFETRRGPGQVAPATARFARIIAGSKAGSPAPVWLDAASIVKTSPEWRAAENGNTAFAANGVFQVMAMATEIRDYGDNYNDATGIWTVTQEGPYRIDLGVFAVKFGGGSLTSARVKIQQQVFGVPGFFDFIGPISDDTVVVPNLGEQDIRAGGFVELPLAAGNQYRLLAAATWTGQAPDAFGGDNNTYWGAKLITAD